MKKILGISVGINNSAPQGHKGHKGYIGWSIIEQKNEAHFVSNLNVVFEGIKKFEIKKEFIKNNEKGIVFKIVKIKNKKEEQTILKNLMKKYVTLFGATSKDYTIMIIANDPNERFVLNERKKIGIETIEFLLKKP